MEKNAVRYASSNGNFSAVRPGLYRVIEEAFLYDSASLSWTWKQLKHKNIFIKKGKDFGKNNDFSIVLDAGGITQANISLEKLNGTKLLESIPTNHAGMVTFDRLELLKQLRSEKFFIVNMEGGYDEDMDDIGNYKYLSGSLVHGSTQMVVPKSYIEKGWDVVYNFRGTRISEILLMFGGIVSNENLRKLSQESGAKDAGGWYFVDYEDYSRQECEM